MKHTNTKSILKFGIAKFVVSNSRLGLLYFLTFATTICLGQQELPRYYKSTEIVFGKNTAKSKTNKDTTTKVVYEKGATWLRLFLKDINLGEKSLPSMNP